MRSFVVCTTHLRASADETYRMQQAAQVTKALDDFARDGEPRIVLADVNSEPPEEGSSGGRIRCVYEYFKACGYRCAYHDTSAWPLNMETSDIAGDAEKDVGSLHAGRRPAYTTWGGWAHGDVRSICDHIFISADVRVAGVLDVPPPDQLSKAFPEKLPNGVYPSDHMSLVADLLLS